MNPQSDPTPGLRLPQPSMNPGAAQPAAIPQQPAINAGFQSSGISTSPLAQAQPLAAQQASSYNAQSEVSAAQAQVATAMQIPNKQMADPNVSNQAPIPQHQVETPQEPSPTALPPQSNSAIAPSTDDNDDSLDEQWIGKAKTTIDQYKADPYMQSKMFSKLKAEYMQNRHNKTLKVEE